MADTILGRLQWKCEFWEWRREQSTRGVSQSEKIHCDANSRALASTISIGLSCLMQKLQWRTI